ncbi:MAG: hypothetical protein KME40_01130 [Komarekiella atlantica HA4396-MV6]|nr:hypothetical protein [Komarekiella atlantica HA4396-MV6]
MKNESCRQREVCSKIPQSAAASENQNFGISQLLFAALAFHTRKTSRQNASLGIKDLALFVFLTAAFSPPLTES